MSVKVMALVWDLKIESNKKFVLLAYADHADHNGFSIFPAVSTIAKKTGYSERSVQRITRDLEEKGLLVDDGTGKKGTNRWRIPYIGGDKIAPLPVGGDTEGTKGVTNATERGDTAMTPEPSLTIKEPSLEPSAHDGNLFSTYEQNIGAITPLMSDALKDAEDTYPNSWFKDAIEIAVSANVRKWSYINGILKRWKVEGKGSEVKKSAPSHKMDNEGRIIAAA